MWQALGARCRRCSRSVAVGQRVLLDDGKIAGVVEESSRRIGWSCGSRGLVRRGDRLRADKGMNFPDTELSLPALTSEDIDNLEFIAANADMVSYSFVRRPEDVRSTSRTT